MQTELTRSRPSPDVRSWRDRLAMTSVFVANGIAFGAWAGNLPRLREAAGLDDRALGFVLLSAAAGAVLAMVLAGRLAAWMGTRRLCWMTALALGAALPLPSLAAGHWEALLGCAVLMGLALGSLDVAMNAHAAGIERAWGAAIMSSFHAGWSAGELAGALAAGALAALGLSLLGTMALSGVLLAGFGLAALRLPMGEGAPAAEQRAQAHETEPPARAHETEAPAQAHETEPPARAHETEPPARAHETEPRAKAHEGLQWPGRAMLLICLLTALSFAVEGGVADWSGVYLATVIGAPPSLAASSLTGFALTMLVCRLWGDQVVRALGPALVVRLGGLLTAAGLGLAVVADGVWLAAAGFALVGVGVANTVPVLFSAAGRRGPGGVAAMAAAGYGAMMAAPPLLGLVSAGFGLRVSLLVLAAGALAVAAFARGASER